MIEKLSMFFRAFRLGSELAGASIWKDRQRSANELTLLLVTLAAIARAFGVDIPLDDETAAAIALGAVAAVNWVLTITTSTRAGLSVPAGGGMGGGGNGSPDRAAERKEPASTNWQN